MSFSCEGQPGAQIRPRRPNTVIVLTANGDKESRESNQEPCGKKGAAKKGYFQGILSHRFHHVNKVHQRGAQWTIKQKLHLGGESEATNS